MARIAVLKHFECEGPETLADAPAAAGHSLVVVSLHNHEPLPGPEDFDAWLIMGGPMSVDELDQHPYLLPERRLVAELVRRDRPVLGICLGAQIIARAAGARVYPQRPKEIGLCKVRLMPAANEDPLFTGLPNPLEVFQWHGDTFDLPAAGVWLASSQRYPHQAFRLGRRVYAIQFHLECTLPTANQWFTQWRDQLAELPEGERQPPSPDRLRVSLERQRTWSDLLATRWSALFDQSPPVQDL